MNVTEIQNWIGVRFTIFTFSFLMYVVIFSESVALPISRDECNNILMIISPLLLAQLLSIFQWYTAEASSKKDKTQIVILPPWMVKAPLYLALGSVLLVLVMLICQELFQLNLGVDAGKFKLTAATAVALLNATTFCILNKVFSTKTIKS